MISPNSPLGHELPYCVSQFKISDHFAEHAIELVTGVALAERCVTTLAQKIVGLAAPQKVGEHEGVDVRIRSWRPDLAQSETAARALGYLGDAAPIGDGGKYSAGVAGGRHERESVKRLSVNC